MNHSYPNQKKSTDFHIEEFFEMMQNKKRESSNEISELIKKNIGIKEEISKMMKNKKGESSNEIFEMIKKSIEVRHVL